MLKFIVGAAKNLQECAGCCALFATYYIRKGGAGNPVRLALASGRGRGLPRPYGVVGFVCCGNRKFPPHQSPAVTASPTGGSLCKPLLSAAQFAGNRGRMGLLFTAQFAASVLLSAAQFLGCYSRHSLVLRRGGCYSRHNSKPLLFTAHFRFLRRKSGCYRRHNCVWGCYSRHNSAGLLNTAQLPPPAA